MTGSANSLQHARNYGLFINGTETETEAVSQRFCPGTGEHVATFASGTAGDALDAIAVARRTFEERVWSRKNGPQRSHVLLRLAELMRENAEYLARIEAEEVGKPVKLARGDVAASIAMVEHAAALAQTASGEAVDNVNPDVVSLVVREPAGVIGMITPWNFPLLQLSQKLPYALAAGCTAVIKPAEITAGSTVEMARFCKQAGVPDGVVNVVTGRGSVVGNTIAASPDVDVLSFTGSTEVGARITEVSAATTKRLSMELGGKAAAVVLPDADLEQAANGVVFGAIFNSGECCVATTRLIVHESIADELISRVIEIMGRVRVGPPLDDDSEVGAMIHEAHLESVLGYIEKGVAEGGTILLGGNRLIDGAHASGFYVEPTIIDGVKRGDTIFQEEIFGPVLAVTRFATVEEAAELVNAVDYGLANTIWSAGIQTAIPLAKRLRSGSVWVNTTLENAPQMPTGGLKRSGYGREMGTAGYEEFTEPKTITLRLKAAEPFFGI
ncbi:aldehyde dehydrogenase family protein [Leucobacter tenebrionis]|uniref:aldehyde dehydrogenase family protein n=1 Tax=Leucobacter tenebrionis TaxID=2873270 RepID=UPI001CA727BE|nr:aldehyde dehydrogenase family protein [Leucobacter tenebrionis]QZY50915.1 aldehyde dehydrogenase family protein [Leucobacter tenebrionis]